MIKFVLVSVPRTGSSILQQNLNSSSQIEMHGEIFHPKIEEHLNLEILSKIDIAKRDNSPLDFINDIFKNSAKKLAVGFKIFEGHNNNVLDGLLKNPDIKKIILHRNNYLASYSSLLISEALDYWNDSNPDAGVQEKKVLFDEKIFEAYYTYYEECYKNWRSVIRDNWGQKYLEVEYCPNDSMLSSAKSISAFLGLDETLVKVGAYKKVNSKNILGRFINQEAVLSTLSRLKQLSWIEE